MNPRYPYPSYTNPYRMPVSGTNYFPWLTYPDPSVQLIYLPPQYTQFPMVHQYDPMLYAPSVPYVWRPPPPTFPQQVYSQMMARPLLRAASHQNRRQAVQHCSRNQRGSSKLGKASDNVAYQTNQAAGNDAELRPPTTDSRVRPCVKSAGNETSVFHQLRSSTALYRQKRRVRRERRRRPNRNNKQAATADLSSINLDGTRDREKSEFQTVENDDADYETCDEDDTSPTAITGPPAADKHNTPKSVQSRTISRNSTEFTSISNGKSCSHIAFDRDQVAVKTLVGSGKRSGTFVMRTTKKNFSLNRKSVEEIQDPENETRRNAPEDYWAAVSNVESFWTTNGESFVVPASCSKDDRLCRCKNCAGELAEKNRNRSSSAAASPDLWWDRSAGVGWWPTSYKKDYRANVSAKNVKIVNYSNEFVVVDLNPECNEEVAESDKKCPQTNGEQSNIDSIILRKRRLLPVDWDSISECRQDLESRKVGDLETEFGEKVPSIRELDNAIVEHGPVTTEPCYLPTTFNASIGLNSEAAKVANCIPSEKRADFDEMAGLFQTAFNSDDDTCEANSKKIKINSGNLQKRRNWTTSGGKELEDEDHCPAKVKEQDCILKLTCGVSSSNLPRDLIQKMQRPCSTSYSRTRTVQSQTETVNKNATEFKSRLFLNDNIDNIRSEVDKAEDVSFTVTEKPETKRHQGRSSTACPALQYGNIFATRNTLSKPKMGFNFPLENNAFRKRVSAVSYDTKGNFHAGRETRPPVLGRGITINKKIYENSKPTPLLGECAENLGAEGSEDVKTCRTAPSSPTRNFPLIRKSSLSMSDLHDALTTVTGNEGSRLSSKDQRISKKNSKRRSSQKEGTLKSKSTSPKSKGVKSSNKSHPPKLQKLQDARCPTGFSLNSMLNDTIRRNFRQRSSPVAIFAMNRHRAQYVGRDTIVVSSPSIDDWTTIALQSEATLTLADCHGKEVGKTANRQVAGGMIGRVQPTRFVQLPVLFYPPLDASRARPHGNAKRNSRNRVISRRRSLSSLHYSVLSKRMRQRRRSAFDPSGPNAELPPRGPKISVNRTYPAFSIVKAEKSDGVGIVDQSVKVLSPESSETTADPDLGKKAFEGATTAPKLRTDEKESVAKEIVEESKDILGEINKLYQPNMALDDDDHETKTDTTSSGGKKGKNSFLKRLMKGKRRSKDDVSTDSSSADGRGAPRTCTEANEISLGGVIKKPSRQERLRANFLLKKRRFLGKDSKARTRAIASADVGDVNDNSQIEGRVSLAVADAGGTSSSYSRPQSTGDKTVKNALYKPTLVCMAAIEVPTKSRKANDPRASSPTRGEKSFAGNPSQVPDRGESLQTSIRHRREAKSVAGTPGVRINSETGDILEASEARSLTTLLSSTKILENDNAAD